MQSMKLFFASACAAAMFFFVPVLPAQSNTQAPSGQAVSGTTQEVFGQQNGNTQAGGNVAGWSGGSFSATDPNVAAGIAIANGHGSGSQTIGPNSASSTSASVVNSKAGAFGDNTSVGVAGGAAQSNWANTGTDTNFAGGYNTTAGSYNGTGSTEANGKGEAFGVTNASASHTANTAQSAADTFGQSAGIMHGATGSAMASGYGIVGDASMVGTQGQGSYAGGSSTGTAAFNASGAQNASGFLAIKGQNSGFVGNQNVSAQSSITAIAVGNGSTQPPPGTCGCGKP